MRREFPFLLVAAALLLSACPAPRKRGTPPAEPATQRTISTERDVAPSPTSNSISTEERVPSSGTSHSIGD